MIHGKIPRFGFYRKKTLIPSGMQENKDKSLQHIAVKLKCDECGKFATLKYDYSDWLNFFGKHLPSGNEKLTCTEECENCGAIYLLDQRPEVEYVTGHKPNKSRLGQHGSGPSDPDKIYPGTKFDVYDDGDYLIR